VLSRVSSEETPSVVEQGLIRWFAVREEIERIEAEIQEIQSKADQQSSSIDNLHRYVADEDALRKTADDRLGRADSQLDAARAELTQRQGQLDKAIRDFELSQRISQEGKLVFLSRETIQRESRWIELSLKLVAPETSLGFDQALARAEKVRALKAEIRREREGVAATTGAERYSGRSAETRNEEEFYETLR
jgi:septal ring factor EnvC (AmiA/AmiB activator)